MQKRSQTNFGMFRIARILVECGSIPTSDTQSPLRCRRFAYSYALDSSEFPCYLVWPQREERLFILLDTATNDTLLLDERSSFRPLGIQHFYDSFALTSQICIRSDALALFDLREDELLPDLHITKAGVLSRTFG